MEKVWLLEELKMNKKAQISENINNFVVYFLLVLLFFSFIFASLSIHKNGTAVWQEYYVNEIRKSLELAKPGDEIILNVQKAVDVAGKNKYNQFENMFSFDNQEKEFCVKLDYSGKTCKYYFNDIEILGVKTIIGGDKELLLINIKPLT